MSHVMNTYARLPIRLERGEGAWLIDDQGRRFLDSVTGIGVCSLGHAHPEIASAVADQAATLVHAANLTHIPVQEQLADRLAALSGLEAVFFCNSGAESLECAFKIARMYGHQQEVDDPVILVAEGSFHGRTLACLSATDSVKVQKGFEPLVSGFERVPFNDAEAAAAAFEAHPEAVAILVEPIQGEGGVAVPDPGYLARLREICDQFDALLLLDEVQTGIGKTGSWFAFQHEGIQPDVVSCAKALGNGVPIGACLAAPSVSELLQPGKHGSTYGGNPLACRAALTVLEVMERDQLPQRAAARGEQLLERLRQALGGLDSVVEIRGKGFMIGIELDRPCGELRDRALERGMILNVTRDRVIRLLPPLVASENDLDTMIDHVIELVREF